MNKLLDTVPASVGSLIKDLSLLRKRAHGGRPSPRRSWDLLDPMAQARMTCRSPGADELPELPLPSSTWLLSTHLWGLAPCPLPPKAVSPAQLLPLAGWGVWGGGAKGRGVGVGVGREGCVSLLSPSVDFTLTGHQCSHREGQPDELRGPGP